MEGSNWAKSGVFYIYSPYRETGSGSLIPHDQMVFSQSYLPLGPDHQCSGWMGQTDVREWGKAKKKKLSPDAAYNIPYPTKRRGMAFF